MGRSFPFLFLLLGVASLTTVIVSDLWKFSGEVIPCSSRGNLDGEGNCVCQSQDYFGDDCFITSCYGIFSNNSDVCSSHGICTDYDQCACSRKYHGLDCNITYCFGILSTEHLSCGEHGTCEEYHNCTCNSGYYGELCDQFDCYGLSSTDNTSCSGHGECASPNECRCDNGFFNITCNQVIDNEYFSLLGGNQSLMTPPNYTLPFPGSRARGSNFYVDQLDRFYFFGALGVDENRTVGLYNDLWYYSLSTDIWVYERGNEEMNGLETLHDNLLDNFHPSNIPRSRCCFAFFGSKSQIYVHGGAYYFNSSSNLTSTNDLWEYETSEQKWRKLLHDSTGVPSVPSKRAYHCSASDSKTASEIYLFGGVELYEMEGYNDLWKFDALTNTFSFVKGDKNTGYNITQSTVDHPSQLNQFEESNVPIPRGSSQCWVYQGNFYVFSGLQFYGGDLMTQDDLWVFNNSLTMWGQIYGQQTMSVYTTNEVAVPFMYDSGNYPAGRGGSSYWKIGEELYFFGGSSKCDNVFGDVWSYSINLKQFKFENGSSSANPMPSGKNTFVGGKHYAFGGIDTSHEVLLFGGIGPLASTAVMTTEPEDSNNVGFNLTATTANVTILNFQYMRSEEGNCTAFLKKDGKFSVYCNDPPEEMWDNGVSGFPSGKLKVQTDGNVVYYDSDSVAKWSTDTSGNGVGCRFVMQDDGNLVLYSATGTALWDRFSGRLY